MAMTSETSEAALVIAIIGHESDALAEAYRRHAGAVFGLARRVLRETAVAEEVVQDVFLRLWNHAERYDPSRGCLRSFLLTQTHGRSVDVLRSDIARHRRGENEARARASTGDDFDQEMSDPLTAECLRTALGQLPDEERRPIELAYFGGHTYRSVAKMLGEPEGTVKSRIRSGLRRLRIELAEAGVTIEDL
jgi:RNA polymerase sigma-70 factor, ECF subfamily